MNMYFDNFLYFLDAKSNVTVWKNEKENLFSGKVYEIYNNDFFKNNPRLKIKDISTGISILNILIDETTIYKGGET